MESDQAYLLRRIDFGQDLGKLTSFPAYFEIETVNACNARCPMCTIADWNRKDGNMKPALFDKIAAELKQNARRVKRVHLYRDGEPLLDKRLPDRIARLKEAGIREVGISTNAELLSDTWAQNIFAAGIDEIILSVDSMDRKVYEKIRVGLDFATVVENCKQVIFTRNRMNSKCRLRIRMIRQQSNNHEWIDGSFQRYWAGRGLNDKDSVEARLIHNWGGQLEGFKELAKADTQRPCLALWSLCVIFATGVIPLCNVDFNAHYPVGNVNDNTIAELWAGVEQNRRREIHMSHQRAQIKPCANCTVWSEEART